jgi:hypothetical protein
LPDPDSIINKVLEKVCDQLFAECADRVLFEDIPDDMQNLLRGRVWKSLLLSLP